ncbi:hypothetical protein [Halogeometricum limi]|uniref:Uncharacterized protein n=1 Tax=Halogeometricum limi TaxID=555875 RepID=A0A1I6HAF7_9EURY|nr:hypothetical protein [Halogeometricum limi]SFR51442.1 hypothetical protein SAMN04488124_1982 [Halogeometricum limi]
MSSSDDGFAAFYRRYSQTWVHAVATAALTAFGMLTFVNKLFAVVAIAAYVLPPIVQYVRGSSGGTAETAETTETTKSTETAQATGGKTGETDESIGGEEADETASEKETADEEPTEPEWTVADVPTDGTLLDAVVGDSAAYAVGEGGIVVARDGAEWTAVFSDGPGADANTLRGVDSTDGGTWVVGDGGAVGRIGADGTHVDHSAPDGDTSAISDVAASADGTDETVLLTDSSGRVRRGQYRDGELRFEDPTKPGSGSSIASVELDGTNGYVCDSGGGVFRTADGDRTFESLAFDGDGAPTDVAVDGGDCLVCDDAGVVHRYDGTNWTPTRVADERLVALSCDGDDCIAVGENAAYERSSNGWERASLPPVASLRGVDSGASGVVCVGEDGTVVERVSE